MNPMNTPPKGVPIHPKTNRPEVAPVPSPQTEESTRLMKTLARELLDDLAQIRADLAAAAYEDDQQSPSAQPPP